MESDVTRETTEYGTDKVTVSVETDGSLSDATSEASEQWQKFSGKVRSILDDLPDYVSEFFGEYKRTILTISLIIGAFIAVKLLFALLGAINEIPLLAPLFELIGLGYAAWFVYRYLWRAESRQELGTDFSKLKQQVLGRYNSEI